jgi:hypothetical protein
MTVEGIDKLKVIPFTSERVANPYPGGELPWQVYHTVRNAIVRTCRRHGPTGPMGEVKIVEGVESPYARIVEDADFWQRGDSDPHYHIIDDQYNHERYIYAELYGDDPFTTEWLAAITATLREHRGWGLGIGNIPDSYILIFEKRLMVKGGKLSRCKTVTEVVAVAAQMLKHGKKEWWQFWK